MAAERLRRAVRAVLPLGLRLALRRAPAIARYLLAPAPRRAGDLDGFEHLQCERASPLARPGAPYPADLQRGKAENVALAAARLDGLVVGPGETFSWHRVVGPPLRMFGWRPGPEVCGDAIVAGLGGGACQAANMILWLGLHAGLEVVERHRHDVDLFPDHERSAPFGSGATVFYPTRDLRLRNPGKLPVRFGLRVVEGVLRGEARTPADPGFRWALLERDHRFLREGGATWRTNRLVLQALRDGVVVSEVALGENRARTLYDVPELGDAAPPERPAR